MANERLERRPRKGLGKEKRLASNDPSGHQAQGSESTYQTLACEAESPALSICKEGLRTAKSVPAGLGVKGARRLCNSWLCLVEVFRGVSKIEVFFSGGRRMRNFDEVSPDGVLL